ncbi:DUF2513 domain-containing protein [Romboutsia sp. 1001713B170207_170306_H8]|uniref:DUF2513 domain-containing protein n=1 Tax=Romboutsia sp. 1001713B170207_170306_H8 TaxID=2787112 RepID=UPI001A9A742B|nr:DUF2513 domain-containing protein [Romboutsia sp. 1001713B170207_170306_H8]
MRLNDDCVRDILLLIEKSTDNNNLCVDTDFLIHNLTKYTEDEIFYHIRQIHKYDYVDFVEYADDNPYFIGDLTPLGRNFVDNIRDNKVWSSTKKIVTKLSSVSLPILSSVAERELSKFLGL